MHKGSPYTQTGKPGSSSGRKARIGRKGMRILRTIRSFRDIRRLDDASVNEPIGAIVELFPRKASTISGSRCESSAASLQPIDCPVAHTCSYIAGVECSLAFISGYSQGGRLDGSGYLP